jgi:hypothetical protein
MNEPRSVQSILKHLPKKAKTRLRRYECPWCGCGLNTGYCMAIYEKCSTELRIKRIVDCLSASSVPSVRYAASEITGELTR